MRAVSAILLILELFGALAYAMPKGTKGKKGRPQLSGSSATSTKTKTKGGTSTPVFPPSHWVNTPYTNCNAEKTEMINKWIMDAYNMTYEAEHMTHDNPAFIRYFFREDFSDFKTMIHSFNSRAHLGDRGKYHLKCAEYKPGSVCKKRSDWAFAFPYASTVYFCPVMFHNSFSKVPYSSKPFDNSPNGWCQPGSLPPHPSHVQVHEMAHLVLLSSHLRYPVSDYHDGTKQARKAAYNLKSRYASLRAKWEQRPRSRINSSPPVPPLYNAESYAASIVDFYFARKCGKDFIWS
ncbi:hypothetical protein F5050DRAFT_1807756 [Lentinula boryana]|uniref:Lysine-specific metallo-endopeptidase domain-containing protein n=1 Tax=Lentinula boryana TaxID=40481 RepID=A0ABQ8QD76_9AGAR|nr:hypothetical protein F5050DRAFT_1807756 [Lentinula boryana]